MRPSPSSSSSLSKRLLLQQQQTRSLGMMVLGCGSSVVDEFYPLRRFPKVRVKVESIQ